MVTVRVYLCWNKNNLAVLYFLIHLDYPKKITCFLDLFSFYVSYSTQLHLPPSYSTVSEDPGIESRTAATFTRMRICRGGGGGLALPIASQADRRWYRQRIIGTILLPEVMLISAQNSKILYPYLTVLSLANFLVVFAFVVVAFLLS